MKLKTLASNMTELELSNGSLVLFSYSTPVAAFVTGRGFLRTAEHFSVTTSKHINKWLGGCDAKSVPQAEIESLTR